MHSTCLKELSSNFIFIIKLLVINLHDSAIYCNRFGESFPIIVHLFIHIYKQILFSKSVMFIFLKEVGINANALSSQSGKERQMNEKHYLVFLRDMG